jgi:HAD superfamily hydrolase (TIGR01509 family)
VSERRPAVLFDIDGTLVDSNYLHVHAWHRAFRDAGLDVESWRIHRSIGMDGATLLETLTEGADDSSRDRAKELHTQYYQESTSLLQILPGGQDLLRRIADLGLQVVLATSAPEDELAVLRELLKSEDVVSAVTSSEDVGTAKPEPDIVQVALERAGVPAERAVFVGDAVWDVIAAERAGVPAIGLLSGGFGRGELEDAGATEVFDNAADLRDHLEQAGPIADLLRSVG